MEKREIKCDCGETLDTSYKMANHDFREEDKNTTVDVWKWTCKHCGQFWTEDKKPIKRLENYG